MSWGTCYSGSNNIHFNFPPIMTDGRNYATWQPGAVVNEIIREKNNITSNSQYRQYLTHNATEVMQANLVGACDACGFNLNLISNDNNGNGNNGSITPFLFSSPWDQSQPFGYESSDLKNLYLSRYELQSRMMAPSLSQEQYLTGGYPNPNS
jgi:hypothetical protein